MKYFIFLPLFLFVSSCGLRERELELTKKIEEVNQREQNLSLMEKTLQLKEEELSKREMLLDSSSKMLADTTLAQHPQLPGTWNVTMRCTETTCAGSAVGDIKNEQWQISYQNQDIVAQAFSDSKLVRVYTGSNTQSTVELSTKPDNSDPSLSTKMIVRLHDIKETEIRGQREIIRPDNCHIIYALDLKKQ